MITRQEIIDNNNREILDREEKFVRNRDKIADIFVSYIEYELRKFYNLKKLEVLACYAFLGKRSLWNEYDIDNEQLRRVFERVVFLFSHTDWLITFKLGRTLNECRFIVINKKDTLWYRLKKWFGLIKK